MANPDRLTALDATFLHLERANGVNMHVASCMIFEGDIPPYTEFLESIESRLHLVPRYRQRLAWVPYGQGRPVWVDDPHFNARFHVRHTALPRPGSEQQLKNLAGRVFSQQLDREKPLWEIWLVDKLEGDRFALLAKTHHALVDGISGVDITTVLFDTSPDAAPPPPPERPWVARPPPSGAQLLGEALLERATMPAEIARGVRAVLRGPGRVLSRVAQDVSAVGALASGGLSPAPHTPLNVSISPHRRFDWVDAELDRFKAIKNVLGGTINDVVLSAVSLALGRWLRDRAFPTTDLTLKAMVPVSVRADVERGALGNKVAAMWASLPVWSQDPVETFALVHAEMGELKESGQAVGATVLTGLSDFAPPTIMSQAARLQSRQRFINLVVTNVPGPQYPLYLSGRRMLATEPMVPLAENLALGIAIMSYDGMLHFGLNGDYDALADIAYLAADLRAAIATLSDAAGLPPEDARPPRPRAEPAEPAPPDPAEAEAAAADAVEVAVESDPEAPPMAFSMPRSRPGTRSPRRDAGRTRRSP
ncbi:MAG TPA: wax ester/triacylglycerol synthase family O-acyltransferase [Solirubrobacteraceae bacterium]|jgi:WS/DGAT/MGAT family acyltransferase|nr:wax ester/triacylglycerol synthase family O-acyltransferase [Solirubrobacteraceae bacterium]